MSTQAVNRGDIVEHDDYGRGIVLDAFTYVIAGRNVVWAEVGWDDHAPRGATLVSSLHVIPDPRDEEIARLRFQLDDIAEWTSTTRAQVRIRELELLRYDLAMSPIVTVPGKGGALSFIADRIKAYREELS